MGPQLKAAIDALKAEQAKGAGSFDWQTLLQYLPQLIAILVAVFGKTPAPPGPQLMTAMKSVGCTDDQCAAYHAIICHCLCAAHEASNLCCPPTP